jgi:hypothetical protein
MTSRSYRITIEAGALTGFYVRVEDEIAACFSTAAELATWLEYELRPLDQPAATAEPMPSVLQSDDSAAKPGRWRLLRGGRT